MNQPTWITSLGDNSVKITYPAAAALADIMDTTETWLLAHGWELYDSAAGTNARAYRALNKDGSTYKYIVLGYNTANRLMVKTYESWNAVTHVGTNLCYLSDDSGNYAQQIDLTNGAILYVFAQASYLIISSYLTSSTVIGSPTGNSWCGCIEITRDNPEDTVAAGYPCWGWANGYLMMAQTFSVFSFPRARDGSVGASASYTAVGTLLGLGGYNGVSNPGPLLQLAIPSATNIWANKNWALTVRVGKLAASEIKGRLFGLKVLTKTAGTFLDDINIKTAADGFYSPSGTPTAHWVLTESSAACRFAFPK